MAGRKASGLNFDPNAELIDPLDYRLLGGLPKQGTLIFEAIPDGRTSRQLSKELFDGAISPSKIGPRMNAMVYHGLVVKVRGIGSNGAHMYQITPSGETRYETWKAGRDE